MSTLLSWPFNCGETIALAIFAAASVTMDRWFPRG